tara:strand:+ start:41 stop:166 length:126 start_codon:yes stop_codon:yes gene_type:complete
MRSIKNMLILIEAFPAIIEMGSIPKSNSEELSKKFNLLLNN